MCYEVNAGNIGRNAAELLRRVQASQFVAEHARELGLVVKLHDEPVWTKTEPPGTAKAFMLLCSSTLAVKGKGCGGKVLERRSTMGLDVALDFWVFHKRHAGADEHVELASEFFFVLDAETAEKRGLHRDRALQEQGE